MPLFICAGRHLRGLSSSRAPDDRRRACARTAVMTRRRPWLPAPPPSPAPPAPPCLPAQCKKHESRRSQLLKPHPVSILRWQKLGFDSTWRSRQHKAGKDESERTRHTETALNFWNCMILHGPCVCSCNRRVPPHESHCVFIVPVHHLALTPHSFSSRTIVQSSRRCGRMQYSDPEHSLTFGST